MEQLADAVKSSDLSRTIKRERSLTSKIELYVMCAEKICDYVKDQTSTASPNKKRSKYEVTNVLSAVFDGFRSVYLDLQESFVD